MNCPRCNHVNDDNATVCSVCSAALTNDYSQPYSGRPQDFNGQQPPQSPPQGQYYPPAGQYYPPAGQYNSAPGYNPNMYNANYVDRPDTLMNVISFFLPIVGIILYFVDREKTPVKARAALKWSLISICVSVVFFVIYFVALFVFMFAAESYSYF